MHVKRDNIAWYITCRSIIDQRCVLVESSRNYSQDTRRALDNFQLCVKCPPYLSYFIYSIHRKLSTGSYRIDTTSNGLYTWNAYPILLWTPSPEYNTRQYHCSLYSNISIGNQNSNELTQVNWPQTTLTTRDTKQECSVFQPFYRYDRHKNALRWHHNYHYLSRILILRSGSQKRLPNFFKEAKITIKIKYRFKMFYWSINTVDRG